MNFLRKYPLHPMAFAIFPVLSLLANNISEVDSTVIIRPLIIAAGGSLLLLGVGRSLIRNGHKAAVIVSLIIIFFFSYGHIYQLVKNKVVFDVVVGRHRYLMPVLVIILVVSIWFVLKKIANESRTTQAMNVISIALLIYPMFQIIRFGIRTQSGLEKASELAYAGQRLKAPETGELPDIYYIVLDSYTREDALREDYDFDNSPFLDELRSLGFYVADCSRSNYWYTQGSITATLNLNYLTELAETLEELGLEESDLWVLMKESLARKLTEQIGYKIVAFETGYEWSRIRNADIYLAIDKDPIVVQRLEPFESMLIDSTALVLFSHAKIQDQDARSKEIKEKVKMEDFPYFGYAQRQLFILDQLPEISKLSESTFAIVHSLIPHVPYVFDPNGEIWNDPGFYSGERAEPINDWYWQVGYTSEIQFINQRLIDIFKEIFKNSGTPPIIVIQADHGLRGDNRLQIFNAYYFPGEMSSKLYRNISPVNSFRLIFDSYFGTNYGLIEDLSFYDDELKPETSQECILGS